MNKKLIAASLLAVAPMAAQADILGAHAGAYVWQQKWSGDVRANGDTLDVEKDLGYDDDSGSSFYVALEHPIIFIPELRLQRTELEISERNDFQRQVNFAGATFNVNDTVDSTTDLGHTDATFYYEILDNWLNLDVGLTARIFDGEVRLKTNNDQGQIDVDPVIPMAYVQARFDLPFTGLYGSVLGNVLSIDDNSVTDTTINLGYEVGVLGFELGYRNFDVDLEDNDERAKVNVDGYFLGVVIDI